MNRIILTLLGLLLVSLPAAAGSLPDYYPEGFQSWGKLNRLDTERSYIVINDEALRLASQVKVYTSDSRFGTLNILHNGMTVGVQVRGNNSIVTEVWVLPADYHPQIRALFLKKD